MDEDAYVVNVEAAVHRGDEYLLIERADNEEHAAGLLAFPGGKVEQEPGNTDTIETTAAREIAEETGVEVDHVEYVRSRTFEIDPDIPVITIVTRCTYESGEAEPLEPEEVAAVHWLTPEEIREQENAPEYLLADVDAIEAGRRSYGAFSSPREPARGAPGLTRSGRGTPRARAGPRSRSRRRFPVRPSSRRRTGPRSPAPAGSRGRR